MKPPPPQPSMKLKRTLWFCQRMVRAAWALRGYDPRHVTIDDRLVDFPLTRTLEVNPEAFHIKGGQLICAHGIFDPHDLFAEGLALVVVWRRTAASELEHDAYVIQGSPVAANRSN